MLIKRSSPTEIRTLAKGFKVLCANPYTIGLLAAVTTGKLHFNRESFKGCLASEEDVSRFQVESSFCFVGAELGQGDVDSVDGVEDASLMRVHLSKASSAELKELE